MNRTLNVVRMQLVNKMTYIWVPLLILAGSFLLSVLIFALIPAGGVKIGGGAQAPLWYFLVVGVQALSLTFPFSQAMSVTRREFHVGTFLTAVLTGAILSTIFTVGGFVEQWTGGWGVNGYFFRIPWISDEGWAVTWLVFFAIAMFFFAVGYWAAGIYKRWGSFALTAALLLIGLVLVGFVALLTVTNGWIPVFTWIAQQGPLTLAGALLALVVVLGVSSYATLRRTTP